ncbi:MAG: hypothetical protein JEZ14_23060 [Marinilabiliaceae bacterium]|nr:hypothetical protein [Marinilabiliaceae bacterium]
MTKILKQNGVNGKIMRAQQSGKVLKQNYNFGKGWKSYNLNGEYVSISKQIPINTAFSVGFFGKRIGSSTYTYTFFTTDLGDNNLRFSFSFAENHNAYWNGNISVPKPLSNGLACINFDGNQGSFFNQTTFTNIGTGGLTSTINTILLLSSGNATNYQMLNGLFIFDRVLTINEAVYRDNNHLGNEFLNKLGLINYYPLTQAKILNVGGNNKVGIEDVISGEHGTIENLPAGTLQEQLDYANTNLFKIW